MILKMIIEIGGYLLIIIHSCYMLKKEREESEVD